MRRRLPTPVLAVALLAGLWAAVSRLGVYRVRLATGRLLTALPAWALPTHFSVLPPPGPEYVGVWDVPPSEARSRLRSEFGFRRLLRAYFHCYDRDGQPVHEVGSYVYRADGFTSDHQLHVRLFPAADGRTELWCHWELNPNVSPLAHLGRRGYDPAEGERRLRDLLEGEPLSTPDNADRPSVADA